MDRVRWHSLYPGTACTCGGVELANGLVNEAERGRSCEWADQSSHWPAERRVPCEVVNRQSDANLFSITNSCSTLAAAAAAAADDDDDDAEFWLVLLVTTNINQYSPPQHGSRGSCRTFSRAGSADLFTFDT